MTDLAKQDCIPCKGGIPPLKQDEINELIKQLNNWDVTDAHHLSKDFKFKDFKEALDFTNKIGAIAEQQGHHPDIWLTWGSVKIRLYTHKIDGLHVSDFILAAKIDRL